MSVSKLRGVRLAAAAGTSAGGLVLLSSGYLVWQAYGLKTSSAAAGGQGAPMVAAKAKESDGPEYILLPESLSDRFKFEKNDAKDELKSRIPRHLRKPWKLLRQANHGEYEAHLNAVRELAKLNLSDGEYRQVSRLYIASKYSFILYFTYFEHLNQIAQSCTRATAVGLARTAEVDLRFFLAPPPCPENITRTATPKLFQRILSELPRTQDVNDCIRFFTSTALDSYVPGTENTITGL